MDECDDRRSSNPPRRQERTCVDLVDNDVVRATRLLCPEPASGAIDAEPRSASHDLHAVDHVTRRSAGDCRREDRDRVAATDELSRNLFGEDLGTPCGGVGEILPVVDQDSHFARRIVSSSCSAMRATSYGLAVSWP